MSHDLAGNGQHGDTLGRVRQRMSEEGQEEFDRRACHSNFDSHALAQEVDALVGPELSTGGHRDGRLRVGDLRARLAHLADQDIVAVQLRYAGDRVDADLDMEIVTGRHLHMFASDCYPEPVGTDPETESTVGVFVLDVWMGDRHA